MNELDHYETETVKALQDLDNIIAELYEDSHKIELANQLNLISCSLLNSTNYFRWYISERK